MRFQTSTVPFSVLRYNSTLLDRTPLEPYSLLRQCQYPRTHEHRGKERIRLKLARFFGSVSGGEVLEASDRTSRPQVHEAYLTPENPLRQPRRRRRRRPKPFLRDTRRRDWLRVANVFSQPASRRHHGRSISRSARSARPRHSLRSRLRSSKVRRSSSWLILTSPRSS